VRSWQPEPPGTGLDPDEVRRVADEILSRAEYREPQPSLVDRVLTEITDFLGRAFATLTGGGPGSVIGLVVTAALVALAIWFLVRALGTRWRRAGPAAEVALVQGTRAPDDPATWLAEADRLAGAGDHRGALRCRYQAMVATLVADRSVVDVPARTPEELRAELVARRGDLADLVGSVTRRFEDAWYGGHDVDPAAEAAFRADARSVESAEWATLAVRS